MKRQGWSAEDKQRFSDRNFLKAQRIPDKRKETNKRECRNRVRWV